MKCPAERPAAGEGSKRAEECGLREMCFMAKLKDSSNDGWNGNKLVLTNDFTGELVFDNIWGAIQ